MPFFRPLETRETSRFYDDLATGQESRSLWGMEKRFSPEVAIHSPSFRRYFVEVLEPILGRGQTVVDVGCGTGMYHPLLAPLCGQLTGVEISTRSAAMARKSASEYGLQNVSVAVEDSTRLSFRDDAFDAAVCVDLLHHAHDLEGVLRELSRVVKGGGDLLIFEPNCLNPALLLMCILDRNERGAVARCYRGSYSRRFSRYFDVRRAEYNGLLIGPQGKLSLATVDWMLESPLEPVLRYFSPKLFFHLSCRSKVGPE